jgi:hypothetical protein
MAPGCEIYLALSQVETAGLIVEHPGTRDGSRARIRSRWEQRSASRSFDSKVSPPSPFHPKQDDNIIDDRTDWQPISRYRVSKHTDLLKTKLQGALCFGNKKRKNSLDSKRVLLFTFGRSR